MAKNTEHIQHIKSSQVLENGKPKLPQASGLAEGELAINFAKGVETISLKNSSGDVVTFSSDNYYTEQKLGSGFTGSNSAKTVTEVIEDNREVEISSGVTPTGDTIVLWVDESEDPAEIDVYTKADIDNKLGSGFTPSSITDVIIENEEIVSAALTDLDNKKLDASAYTPTEGLWVSGTGTNSVAQKGGNNTASGNFAVAEGQSTSATSYDSHAEGGLTLASGGYSHAEGRGTIASGSYSHAEGELTTASGESSHAEGRDTLASGNRSHAEGYNTAASGQSSHAEGANTTASGHASHAEGSSTTAGGYYSHAEGNNTSATTYQAHAEGDGTLASGYNSHAEGSYTKANGYASHAEGSYTTASGSYSHSEGNNTSATTNYSHAEGNNTITLNNSEHASGQYNISASASTTFGDSGNTLFSVGNGITSDARHNAFEIRQNGDIYITSGGTDIKLQDYIGNVETVTAITPSNSGSTAPIATKVVAENELTVSNALNDLNANKQNILSAGTGIDITNDVISVTGGSITVDQVIDSGTSASTNAVATKAVYDYITDNEYVISTAINDLSGQTETIAAALVEIHSDLSEKISQSDVAQVLNSTVSANTNPIAASAVYQVIRDDERTLSSALVDLDYKITLAGNPKIIAASGTTLSAETGNYYRFDDAVEILTITLPVPDDIEYTNGIIFSFTTDTGADVEFVSTAPIKYRSGYSIDDTTTYEINAIYNGSYWSLAEIKLEDL